MEKTGHVENCGQVCGDDRFELIDKIEKDIISATNITKDEEKVLSNILFRLWQRRWLRNSNDIDDVEAKAAAYDRLVSKTIMSDAELDAPLAQRILREMAEKAEAYDRLSVWHDDLPKNDGRYICVIGDGKYPVICAKKFENGRWVLGEREKIKWAYLPDGWDGK